MKFTAILALASTAVAYIEQTVYEDGRVVARWVQEGELPLQKRDCTKNNCLRAMIARPSSASEFCATYTTAPSTAPSPFPNCGQATQASAACTCFAPVRDASLSFGRHSS